MKDRRDQTVAMRKLACQGAVRYWVLLISVVLHAMALAVFTGIRLSDKSPGHPRKPPSVSMQMIETVLQKPTPIPAPKVKPTATIESERKQVPENKPLPKPLVLEDKALASQDRQPVKMDEPLVTLPVSAAVADEVEFFGQKSIARYICYVVDCSGSMYGQMYRVKDKLKESIMALSPHQSFCVIFFMDGRQVLMSGSGHLEPATVRTRSQAYELIDKIKPQGSTDAVHGLECALRLRDVDNHGPDVIYFLTDGFDVDNSDSRLFVDKITGLRNSLAPSTVLHTIGFWPQERDRRMLKTLARLTGGSYVEGTIIPKE